MRQTLSLLLDGLDLGVPGVSPAIASALTEPLLLLLPDVLETQEGTAILTRAPDEAFLSSVSATARLQPVQQSEARRPAINNAKSFISLGELPFAARRHLAPSATGPVSVVRRLMSQTAPFKLPS
jgi:hypothetical protein